MRFRMALIVIILVTLSCTASERPGIGEEFLFSLEPDNRAKVAAAVEAFQKTAKDEDGLSTEILNLPLITGNPERDEAVVAAMHDIVVKGLALEEQSAALFLSVIALQKEAYSLQQKNDGKKKLLHPKDESLFIQTKDQILLRYLRSVNREYAELRKKLGYKLLVDKDAPKGARIPEELLFPLDAESRAGVEQSIFAIREAAAESDRLSEEINKLSFHNDADQEEAVSKMVDLVMQGLVLEEKGTKAFINAVQIQRQAYLQQQKNDGKKVLGEEEELMAIGMKNDTIDLYNRSSLRELLELMKKLFG